MSPLYQSKVVWTNETGLWAKEVAEISILCYIKKFNGGNSLPTKMGGDFSKLRVVLILAFIHICQPETCRETCQYEVICIMCEKNDLVEKFVKFNF